METNSAFAASECGRKDKADEERIAPWWFALRVLWVAVQVVLVLCMGQQGTLFFYQNF